MLVAVAVGDGLGVEVMLGDGVLDGDGEGAATMALGAKSRVWPLQSSATSSSFDFSAASTDIAHLVFTCTQAVMYSHQ